VHPRNKHQDRYDLDALAKAVPELVAFLTKNPKGEATVDFAEPAAVKALNKALLITQYGVKGWEIPEGYLCPPVPGRADHVHHAADLLAASNEGVIPRGDGIRVLDIGTGANLIYPIVGRAEYGWRFVGSDIDEAALMSAHKILQANPLLEQGIKLREQTPPSILKGLLNPEERFDLTLCNPPFNATLSEAKAGTRRKWKGLGREDAAERNFGGQKAELWTPGGEAAFVARLIDESVALGKQVAWFTSLVSRSESLSIVEKALNRAKTADRYLIEMEQGNKKSRLVAWTFLDEKAMAAWRKLRWVR
jgi:23S rRNA (adenine1618-N6)-methyltransferase